MARGARCRNLANRRMIERDISLNLRVADLSDGAALLFTWAIAHTDDYGVIHGDPRRVKAEIVPMRDWDIETVSAYIDEWVTAGLVFRYWHGSNVYILFTGFDGHQTGLERRTRNRALPHPDFTEGCSATPCNGITSANFSEVQGSSEPREVKGSELNRTEPTPLAPVGRPTGAPVVGPVEPVPAKAARRARQTPPAEEIEVELNSLREQFSPADLPVVVDFLRMVREHRASGRLQASAELRFTRELLRLRQDKDMTSEAFAHGLGAAITRGVDNVNYAAKAARGYKGNGATSSGRHTQMRLPDAPVPRGVVVHPDGSYGLAEDITSLDKSDLLALQEWDWNHGDGRRLCEDDQARVIHEAIPLGAVL